MGVYFQFFLLTKNKFQRKMTEIVKKADYTSDSDGETMKSKLSENDERDSGIGTTPRNKTLETTKDTIVEMKEMGHLDEKSLLTSMYDRFKTKKDSHNKSALYHQGLNYGISILL